MTEGPEATHLRNYVARYFKGQRLRSIQIRAGRYKRHGIPPQMAAFQRHLPLQLQDVIKKGKVLFFRFEDGWTMIAKMGMTGWFSRSEDARLFESEPSIVFQFDSGDLYWSDFRNFGTLTFTRDPTIVPEELRQLAPDILDKSTTTTRVYDRVQNLQLAIRKPQLTLEEALMDQGLVVSGVGNIIKSEALYDAKLSPRRTMKSMRKQNWSRVISSSRKISKKVLKYLEERDFTRANYMKLHRVYGRTKNSVGRDVRRYTAKDGRTTFWVPAVQH